MKNDPFSKSRRNLVVRGIALAVSACAAPFVAGLAHATPQGAAEWLRRLETGTPTPGRVKIDAPEISENGNTVPITIRIESPMTEGDFVQALHVVADGNPSPGVASFQFSPSSGRAEVKFRLRLAQSQTIVAVARMNDGTVWSATRDIKVALGGCGG
ncbi:MAG: thiosulfate oxidation carrier protein SoxY [Betaproteobacteria bacterium]|nr:thiosulfate oxidation carrier protein SoxY [Betaproteobacteria bacterium]